MVAAYGLRADPKSAPLFDKTAYNAGAARARRRTSGVTSERPTIIVIEDESKLRRVLRTTLETNGFRCVEAESARQGLTDAQTCRPDLLYWTWGFPTATASK